MKPTAELFTAKICIKEQGMSITEKLAQALRISVGSMERAGWADHGDTYQRATLKKAREALASQSTPASEVDADNFIGDGNNGWKRIQPKPSLVGMMEHVEKHGMQNTHATNSEFWIRDSAALTQQVERLTKQNRILEVVNSGTLANNLCPNCRDKQVGKPCLACTIDTLSADNARLAKDAEMVNSAIGGKYIFFKERHGVSHQTTKALSQLIDFIAKKRDAATAQAKLPSITYGGYDDTGSAPHD